MKAPKTGEMSVLLARDANPVAVAVDSSFVYWSDEGGNIMCLA